MKMRKVEFDFVSYLDQRFGHASRTEGLHVSTIYGDLDRALNAKRYAGDFKPEQLAAFGSIGFLWEKVLEEALADRTLEADPARYFRPGEQEMDGVLMTPDYADLDFHGDGSCVMGLEEWKVVWKSVNAAQDFEKNFWRFLVQMKAYCRALRTNVARIRILFLVGDWREDISPKCLVFEFEFTAREIEENWVMLTGHAKRKGWM